MNNLLNVDQTVDKCIFALFLSTALFKTLFRHRSTIE
jgi:hypothetical protein